jgi:predicted small secreted protein
MRPRALILALAAVSTMAGCLNPSDTLTGAGEDPTPDLGPATATAPRSSTGPSVTGLDRRNWDTVVVTAPRGQVEHQPTYAEPLVLNGGPARNGGTFPTVADATALGASPSAAATEGAAEFTWPAALLLVSPARMVMGLPPWLTVQGPGEGSGMLPPSQARELPGMWVWVAAPRDATP